MSEPCCEEFGVAKNDKKLIVIYKDPISSISDVAPNDFNGAVMMYVKCQNQGLPPNNIEFIAREIYKAVRGSAPPAPAPTPAPAAPSPAPAPSPSAAAVTAKMSAVTVSDDVIKASDDAKSKYGPEPLVTAAEKKDEGAVVVLVGAGYKDLEEKGRWEGTALVNAAFEGLEGAVKVLLAAGANKDAQNKVSR